MGRALILYLASTDKQACKKSAPGSGTWSHKNIRFKGALEMGLSSPYVFPSFSAASLGTTCLGHSWDYLTPRLSTKFSPWLQRQKALKDNSSVPSHPILGYTCAWSNQKFEHWGLHV